MRAPARRRARAAGGPGPLALGRAEIEEGLRLLDRAISLAPPRAVPAAGRDRRAARSGAEPEETDWPQIAALYGALADADGLARRGAEQGRRCRDGGGPTPASTTSSASSGLDDYHLLHARARPAAPARADDEAAGPTGGRSSSPRTRRARLPRAAALGGCLSAFRSSTSRTYSAPRTTTACLRLRAHVRVVRS